MVGFRRWASCLRRPIKKFELVLQRGCNGDDMQLLLRPFAKEGPPVVHFLKGTGHETQRSNMEHLPICHLCDLGPVPDSRLWKVQIAIQNRARIFRKFFNFSLCE